MLTFPLIMIGHWEIIAIVLVIVLIFGGRKIPELMKGLSKGVKSFKEGMKEVDKEVNEVKDAIDSDPEQDKKA